MKTQSQKKTAKKIRCLKRLVDLHPSEMVFYCILARIQEFCEEINLEHQEKLYDMIFQAVDEILIVFVNVLCEIQPDPDFVKLFNWLDRSIPHYWEEPSCEEAKQIFKEYGIDENAKPERFIRTSMAMALHVRNEMEDFHVQYLSDEEMKLLNPKVRQGFFEGFVLFVKGV